MKILIFIIIVVVGITFYRKSRNDIGNRSLQFGKPKVFLSSLIDDMKRNYPRNEVIENKDDKFKIFLFGNGHRFVIEFVYLPLTVNVYVGYDSMIHSVTRKTFDAPYDVDIITMKLYNAMQGILADPNYKML